MSKLTHIDQHGKTSMVDVTEKPATKRRAVASGKVLLAPSIARALRGKNVAKGNVLETARIGGIQAAKETSSLIPLCHPIPLSKIDIDFDLRGNELHITAEVVAEAKTGVEMEALTAVSVAALVVYDMCKGIDKGMQIDSIELLEKEGGRRGHYKKEGRHRSI